MFKFIGLMLVLAVAVCAAAFALQNDTKVAIDLFFIQLEGQSIGNIALMAFIVGSLCGLIAGFGIWFRTKRAEMSVKRKLANSEKELDSLRSNVT